MKRNTLLSMLLTSVVSACVAAPAGADSVTRDVDVLCGGRDFLVSVLAETGAARIIATGERGAAKIHFNVNPDSGRWIIIFTSEATPGVACLLADGTDFRLSPESVLNMEPG